MHTVARASTLLGVSRTTVYKYLNAAPDRYSNLAGGQRKITEQGLELMRADIKASMDKAGTKEPSVLTDNIETIKAKLAQAQERITALELDNTRLTARVETLTMQHDADQAMIQVLKQAREDAQKALDQEQILHKATQAAQQALLPERAGNWLTRMFKRS